MAVDLDKWIEKVKKTEYLAENELKALCEYVSRFSLSNRRLLCTLQSGKPVFASQRSF